MPDCAILMYHRVCERTPESEPYFARGTAVEPAIFHRQLGWLSQNCDVVPLIEWLRPVVGKQRPRVVLTFDDGYLDATHQVAPACAKLGFPWTLFAGPWCGSGQSELLWTDHYYALLGHARRREHLDLSWLLATACAPLTLNDLIWWVRGPPKQALAGLNARRRGEALERLACALEVEVDLALSARELYCSRSALLSLIDSGVTIGGHGATHARLGDVAPRAQAAEISASKAFLDDLGAPNPRSFAYPDGSFDAAVASQVRAAGFTFGVTVAPGMASVTTDSLRLPRHIVRNLMPENTNWCAAFHATGGSSWST